MGRRVKMRRKKKLMGEKVKPKRKRRRRVDIIFYLKCIYIEKKKAAGGATKENEPKLVYAPREQSNAHIRLLGDWKAGDYNQTNPPTIPVSQ